MKKLFALLIAAACLFSLGTAALAEGEEMVPVCVPLAFGDSDEFHDSTS